MLTAYFNAILKHWEVWFTSEPSMACWWASGGHTHVFFKKYGENII